MKTSGTYPRVSLAFARKIDTDLMAFTRNVITLMTGNTQYPTPSPALTVVTTGVNALETAVHDSLDGGKIARHPKLRPGPRCSPFSASWPLT